MNRKALLLGCGLAALCAGVPAHATITNCSPVTVRLFYGGATAINNSVRLAGESVFGGTAQCVKPGNQVSFRGMVDLNNDGIEETCAEFYVGVRGGSCEGVSDLDNNEGTLVCDLANPTGPAIDSKHSYLAQAIDMTGTDNEPANCPVPPVNAFAAVDGGSETRIAVGPFITILNAGITALGWDPAKDGFSRDSSAGTWGALGWCDWKSVAPVRLTGSAAIAPVWRALTSGTRVIYQQVIAKDVTQGFSTLTEPGTGDVIYAVNNNLTPLDQRVCSTKPTEQCGNNPAASSFFCSDGVTACQAAARPFFCASFVPAGSPTYTAGWVGADRTVENPGADGILGTEDDYPVKSSASDNFVTSTYNGVAFSPEKARAGKYTHWSYEHIFARAGGVAPADRQALARKIVAATKTLATQSKGLIDIPTMSVEKACDSCIVVPH